MGESAVSAVASSRLGEIFHEWKGGTADGGDGQQVMDSRRRSRTCRPSRRRLRRRGRGSAAPRGSRPIGLSSLGADMPVEAPLWQFPMPLARSRVPRRTHAFGGSDGSARADAPFRRQRVRDLWSVGHRPMEIGREWVRGWISRKWMRSGAGSTRHARRNGDAGDEDPRLLNGDSSWGARRGTVHGKTKRRTSILPQSPSNAPAPPRISRAVGSPRGVALMRPTMRRRGKMRDSQG